MLVQVTIAAMIIKRGRGNSHELSKMANRAKPFKTSIVMLLANERISLLEEIGNIHKPFV